MEFAMTFAPKLAGALVVLLIGLWITNWIVSILSRRMEKTKVDESLRPFLLSMVSVLLKVMIIFSAARIVGIQTTSFVAILGAAGLPWVWPSRQFEQLLPREFYCSCFVLTALVI
ncbi:MAG: hypothetical protein IPO07_27780 [Haliscomenobacter sp.]|nr:hypothetical protein [Haliscomenobacter sp.]MBK9492171.1 hypothetical protein [Haliscomenobacter sp.]